MSTAKHERFYPKGFSPGSPLSNAVRGGIPNLSVSGKRRLAALARAQPITFITTTMLNWLIIVMIMVTACKLDHWLGYAIAVVLIAGRQGVFGYLMHEQTHWNGIKGRKGDIFTNLFISWPVFVSVERYGSIHLSHHENYFTEKDPDFHRKNGPDWTFPMPWSRLLWLFTRDLLGLNTISALIGKNSGNAVSVRRVAALPAWVQIVYYTVIIALVTIFNAWFEFFILWLLPLLTVIQVRIRISAICEHKYNLLDPSIPDSTPIVKLSLLERIIFPDLNFGYHIYHHMHPRIAWRNLPKVHEIFRSEGLVNDAEVFPTQWSFLRHLQQKDARKVYQISDAQVVTN